MATVHLEYKEGLRTGTKFRFADAEGPDEDTDVVVTIEDWFEGQHLHGYAVSIDGLLTLGQLRELVHKLDREMLAVPPSAQDCAEMARGESLALRRDGGAA